MSNPTTIDGPGGVQVEEGSTILMPPINQASPFPPCHMPQTPLQPMNNPASCRVCVVEVEGRRNLAPSCSTVRSSGMVVNTHTMRVVNAERPC